MVNANASAESHYRPSGSGGSSDSSRRGIDIGAAPSPDGGGKAFASLSLTTALARVPNRIKGITSMGRLTLLATLLIAILGRLCAAADWPAFRGPNGDGVSPEKDVPLNWGPERNIKWKIPLPNKGNSSPIVSKGRIFLTYASEGGK